MTSAVCQELPAAPAPRKSGRPRKGVPHQLCCRSAIGVLWFRAWRMNGPGLRMRLGPALRGKRWIAIWTRVQERARPFPNLASAEKTRSRWPAAVQAFMDLVQVQELAQ